MNKNKIFTTNLPVNPQENQTVLQEFKTLISTNKGSQKILNKYHIELLLIDKKNYSHDLINNSSHF